MKVSLFVFAFLVVSASSFAKPKLVCRNQSVPNGYVVIAYGNQSGCKWNGLDNAMYITKPGKEERVCYGSPIPKNYVVVGTTHDSECRRGFHDERWENVQFIERLE